MQSVPPSPAPLTETGPRAPRQDIPRRALAWVRRRRRSAATHVLRGLCYGIGTGLAGLVFWWLEQHL
ncbi:MAG TPA: hypothetical protein VFP69_18875 [Streptomyces sp.]|nr:hypothetical protein [Streptomyces sp.]